LTVYGRGLDVYKNIGVLVNMRQEIPLYLVTMHRLSFALIGPENLIRKQQIPTTSSWTEAGDSGGSREDGG